MKNSESSSGEGLIGQWQLTESYFDPGDGSGTWQPANANQVVSFNADGSFTSNSSLFEGIVKYEVPNDSTIKFFRVDATEWVMSYNLSDNKLHLRPSCIEGCGLKFVRQ
ncbi:MAG TPA: hypothetical protein VFZ47_04130 [Chitinophagaceae bacterium]